VTLANRDKLVLPSTVEIVYDDGSRERIRLPAETWMRGASFTLHLAKSVAAVTIDPDHALPDKDRTNNVWKG
jgi:hypothetical protein